MPTRAWIAAATIVLLAIGGYWFFQTRDVARTSRASIVDGGGMPPAGSAGWRRGSVDAGATAVIAARDASAPTPTADAHARDQMVLAAREERDTVLASVRDSGPAHEVWEAQGTALLEAFAAYGTVDALACYIAGCAATLTFPSHAAYQRALDQVQGSEPYQAWTGGKRLTIPELTDDGQVIIALVLYRPD